MKKRHFLLFVQTIIFLVVILCTGCSTKRNKKQLIKEDIHKLNPEKLMSNDIALSFLRSAESIDGPSVGFTGVKTDVYKSYEWIIKNSPDSSLITLTIDENPYTRTYAFMALCKRNNPIVKELLKNNINDSTDLLTIDGCFGSHCQLNEIWLSKAKKNLDDKEYQEIRKKFLTDNQLTSICIVSSEE